MAMLGQGSTRGVVGSCSFPELDIKLPEADVLTHSQAGLHDPGDDAVTIATRRKGKHRGPEESLLLANARVASLKKELAEAAAKERKLLAAELHDDVQQILFGLCLNMEAAQDRALRQLPTDLLCDWMGSVQTAMDHLHELTVALRKPVMDNQEWLATLRTYIKNLPLGPDRKAVFETDAKIKRLPPEVAFACFRIVQEALGNAMKHSGGRNLKVRLKASASRLIVSIRDDGRGFDINHAHARALDAGSVGLSSMRERAAAAGGEFEVQSASGLGTVIRASFPIGRGS